jgi:hypothetical protein
MVPVESATAAPFLAGGRRPEFTNSLQALDQVDEKHRDIVTKDMKGEKYRYPYCECSCPYYDVGYRPPARADAHTNNVIAGRLAIFGAAAHTDCNHNVT